MVDTTLDDNRHRFNEWAQTYEHSFMQWLIFNRVHLAVLKHLSAGLTPAHILDIGCGTGRLLRRLQARWPLAALVGIDPSEGMAARAVLLTPKATIYQASAEHLPLQDASQDLVTSTMSFHHWSNQSEGVSEVWRVLKSGGIFILADTNIGHGQPLSRSEVKDLFQRYHFMVVSQANIVPFLAITVARKKVHPSNPLN